MSSKNNTMEQDAYLYQDYAREEEMSEFEKRLYDNDDAKKYLDKNEKIINRAVFRTHADKSLSELKGLFKDKADDEAFQTSLEVSYNYKNNKGFTEEEIVSDCIKIAKRSQKYRNTNDSPWLSIRN